MTKTRTGDNVKNIRYINPEMYLNRTNPVRDPLAIYKRHDDLRTADFRKCENSFSIPISAKNPKLLRKKVVDITKLGGNMTKDREANITDRKK
ncbi:hypothetical protein ACJMK2_031239 [Sinanodonta woodiana]|uniref:Uncharacterized protein n=1 Tax=Sinanodonta woodiana TaxID=1069815 RepID=A0ABD3X075_SINWO